MKKKRYIKKKRYKYRAEMILIQVSALILIMILIACIWSIISDRKLTDISVFTDEVQSVAYTAASSLSDAETDENPDEQEQSEKSKIYTQKTAKDIVKEFAEAHGLSLSMYPQRLIKLLESNPETEDFVLNYPLQKDTLHNIDLSDYKSCSEVPDFKQWDYRWGYDVYGDDVLGITGCGPTCLSMVAIYLLHNTSMNPSWMAEYSSDNGYCIYGHGTAWALMSEGAEGLGLKSEELPLDEGTVVDNLESGHPIICIMGPGIFTKEGHFIVLYGYENGKIKIHDPNSKANSERLWEFEEIEDDIYNIWVYYV